MSSPSTETRVRISLAVICQNEAANIERCLKSVPFASEIVVLDSGSTDKTCELAASMGAKIFKEEWRGFRAQKQRATELCENDWILSLDADESLSPELALEIEALLSSPFLRAHDGYEIPRLSWNMGRWIRHGGWYPDWQLRLFDRSKATWQGGEHVHERVSAKSSARLRAPLHHRPFADLSGQVATNNRYSTLGAIEIHSRGKSFVVTKMIFKPWSKFFETYVFKCGFLDGMPGFIIAVGAAYSVFLKFAKLWEIEKKQRDPRITD